MMPGKKIRNPKFETNGNQMKSNRENPKPSSEVPVWSFLIFEHLNLFRISCFEFLMVGRF
jgi:hypothetical protein